MSNGVGRPHPGPNRRHDPPLLLWAGRQHHRLGPRAHQQEHIRQLRNALATLNKQPGLTPQQRERGLAVLRQALARALAAD